MTHVIATFVAKRRPAVALSRALGDARVFPSCSSCPWATMRSMRWINAALHTIGLERTNGLDEFDTLGLGQVRRMDAFDDLTPQTLDAAP